MRFRQIFIVSLGLNLLLAAFWLVRKNSHNSQQTEAPPIKVVHKTVVEVRTNAPATNIVAVRAKGFRWSQLESEDYPTYIARLRSVGCPERTIEHIILEDLEKVYRDKLREEPVQRTVWLTGPERDAQRKALAVWKLELLQEKADIIKSLLGRELDLEAREGWVTENEAAWFLAFLSDEQAEQTLSIGKRLGEKMETIMRDTVTLKAADTANVEKLFEEMIGEFRKFASAAELEEALLRATYGVNFGMGGDSKTLSVSPEEMRKLVSLQLREENPFSKILRLTQSGMQDRSTIYSPAMLRETKDILGEGRFADFVCAQDPDLSRLRHVAIQVGAPEAFSKIFEVQQLTLQEAESIRSDPNLTRAQKRAELRALQQTTKEAITEVGGEKVTHAYLESGATWWKTLPNL